MVYVPECVPGVRAVVADHLSEGRLREGDGGERGVGTVGDCLIVVLSVPSVILARVPGP